MFSRNIYHLFFSSKYYLNATLLRIGEGYDGVYPALVTYEDALDYRCNHLRLDRWNGCCMRVSDARADLMFFFPTLIAKEKRLWEIIRTLDNDGVLICTNASSPDRALLSHELIHACYADNSRYRNKVNKIVPEEPYKRMLRELDYADVSGYKDEANAYTLTGWPKKVGRAKRPAVVEKKLFDLFEQEFKLDMRNKANWKRLYEHVHPLGCMV